MRFTGEYGVPLLVAHHIWGRDPPSLCLFYDEKLGAEAIIEESQRYSLEIGFSSDVPQQIKERITKTALALLREVSPVKVEARVSLRESRRLSGLSYLVIIVRALLDSLQAFYGESLPESDYTDVLAGALVKSGYTLNQGRSLSICSTSGKSVIYSETYGPLYLEARPAYRWSVIEESPFPSAWAEPNLSEQYLDLLSKLSSLTLTELMGTLQGEAQGRDLARIFNGVWYILGYRYVGDCGEKGECHEIVSVSIPNWLVVYRFER